MLRTVAVVALTGVTAAGLVGGLRKLDNQEVKNSVNPEVSPDLKIRQETKRIAEEILSKGNPFQQKVAEFYLGQPLSQIRPTYSNEPVNVYYESREDVGIAVASITPVKIINDKNISFKSEPGKKLPLISELSVSIGFSEEWMTRMSDEVKALVMCKEYLQYTDIWKLIAPEFIKQFKRDLVLPPGVDFSDPRVEDTFLEAQIRAMPLLEEAFDAAPYILLAPEIIPLLEDMRNSRGLEGTYIPLLYQRAREAGIDLTKPLSPDNFIRLAFYQDSPWIKIIKELFPEKPQGHIREV